MKFSTLLMLEPNQHPLVQELFNHCHHCRVKVDTLYSIVYHTRSGLVTPSVLIADLQRMHRTMQHLGLEKKPMYFGIYSYISISSFNPLEG